MKLWLSEGLARAGFAITERFSSQYRHCIVGHLAETSMKQTHEGFLVLRELLGIEMLKNVGCGQVGRLPSVSLAAEMYGKAVSDMKEARKAQQDALVAMFRVYECQQCSRSDSKSSRWASEARRSRNRSCSSDGEAVWDLSRRQKCRRQACCAMIANRDDRVLS